MKNSHAFSPAAVDPLETRSVPSFMGFRAALPFTFTQGAFTSHEVVVHPVGTFSNGLPPLFTAPNGERFMLRRFGW